LALADSRPNHECLYRTNIAAGAPNMAIVTIATAPQDSHELGCPCISVRYVACRTVFPQPFRLRRQYNRLFEIQQIQIELLEEIGRKRKS
jgi:hypothetical protein